MDFLTEIEKHEKEYEYFCNHFRRFLKTIILSLCLHTTAHQCFSSNSQLTDVGRMLRRFSGAAGQYRYVHLFISSMNNELIFDNLAQVIPAYPYILAMSADSLEVRSQVNGALLQSLNLPKLRFLSAKEGITLI